jgi:hypothetical protein
VPKHKHNANEGERCTYRQQNKKSKRPLLLGVTTAFIMLSPTASGVALASTFCDIGNSPLSLGQSQLTTSQQRVLPKSYRDLLSLHTFATPSISDITNIESSITNTQNQLNTLSKQLPKDPAQQDKLDQAIQAAQSRLDTLNAKLAKAKADYAAYTLAQQTLTSALAKYNQATQQEDNLLLALTQATTDHNAALTALNAQIDATALAKVDLDAAQQNLDSLNQELTQANQSLAAKELLTANTKSELASRQEAQLASQDAYNNALTQSNTAKANLNTAQSNLDTSRAKYDQTVATYNQLLDTYSTVYANYQLAKQQLDQAQADYDNNLIPDPNWTPATYQQEHTRQIPTTTIVPVTTTTLTGGLRADSFNRQNYGSKPPLPTPNEVPTSTLIVPNINYNWGSGQVLNSGRQDRVLVRFTGNIAFPTTQDVRFYAPGDDGVQLYIDGNLVINDWYDKGGGGSQSSYLHFEAGSTHTITLYFYENGGGANVWLYYATATTGYQIIPAEYLGTTSTTTTTYVEQTTYTTETYYTTEVYPNQLAPLIHDPSLLPPLEQAQANWASAQQEQQIAAQNATTGYYNVIDDAQVVNNLYPLLQQAQQDSDAANQLLTNAANTLSSDNSALEKANQDYLEANDQLSISKSKVEEAQQKVNTANIDLTSKQTTYEQNQTTLASKQQTEQTTNATKTTVQESLTAASQLSSAALIEKSASELTLTNTQTQFETSYQELSSAPTPELTPVQEIIDTEPPAPEPKPEEGSAEIPAVIEDLMQVDLAAVDPTELTPAQAEQLVEAALVVFETATEGSPEYQQALDALYLAAQEDDIQVDPQLANIPGVGQAAVAIANVLNLVGNVGADISPKARKKAQTLVVTTLVVGQIAQTAALATASSGGSSNRTNRINRKTGK